MTRGRCSHCGGIHPSTYHTEKYITDEGFPRHPDREEYEKAHRRADKAEKKAFPKGYQEMKKVDDKLGKHELAGKNSKTGKVEVSEKVPKKLRAEVAMHEKTENKILRKK
jgi:hypothetical protein